MATNNHSAGDACPNCGANPSKPCSCGHPANIARRMVADGTFARLRAEWAARRSAAVKDSAQGEIFEWIAAHHMPPGTIESGTTCRALFELALAANGEVEDGGPLLVGSPSAAEGRSRRYPVTPSNRARMSRYADDLLNDYLKGEIKISSAHQKAEAYRYDEKLLSDEDHEAIVRRLVEEEKAQQQSRAEGDADLLDALQETRRRNGVRKLSGAVRFDLIKTISAIDWTDADTALICAAIAPDILPSESKGAEASSNGSGPGGRSREALARELYGALPLSQLNLNQIERLDEIVGQRFHGDYGQTREASTKHFADSPNPASVFSGGLMHFLVNRFVPRGGLIIDPFAGGSTRPLIAALNERRYAGVELRHAQVDEDNRLIAYRGFSDLARVVWAERGSQHFPWVETLGEETAAALITCPPYASLEEYGGGPDDLSNKDLLYEDFIAGGLGLVMDRVLPVLSPEAVSIWIVGRFGSHHLDLDVIDLHRARSWELVDRHTRQTSRTAHRRIKNAIKNGRSVVNDEHVLVFRRVGQASIVVPNAVPEPPRESRIISLGLPNGLLTASSDAAPTADDAPTSPNSQDPASRGAGGWGRLKLGAKTANTHIDCTLRGIQDHCGGKCCKGETNWPPRAGEVRGACDHLDPEGCRLGDRRPATCHLYPLRLIGQDRLKLHFRGAVQGAVCGGCRGKGPPIIEALEPSFRVLFGDAETDRVLGEVREGRDVEIAVPPHVAAALAEEAEWEAEDKVPEPRDWMASAEPAHAIKPAPAEPPPTVVAEPPAERTPVAADPPVEPALVNDGQLTPVERHDDIVVKRDDLFEIAGVRGGKARTCWALAQGAPGLVTAGHRSSPQVNIVARVAQELGIPARVHTPTGTPGPEVADAVARGAVRITHKAGRTSKIAAEARWDAESLGWREIPFGMECEAAVQETRRQVANLADKSFTRLVVPVGSGMSLCGILWGLDDHGIDVPVLGVWVGADPKYGKNWKRFLRYAPPNRLETVTFEKSSWKYEVPVEARVGSVLLDPIYEAKTVDFLQPGDALWIVGIRAGADAASS